MFYYYIVAIKRVMNIKLTIFYTLHKKKQILSTMYEHVETTAVSTRNKLFTIIHYYSTASK